MNVVSCHIPLTTSDIYSSIEVAKNKYKVNYFQSFLGNPRLLKLPPLDEFNTLYKNKLDVDLIIHGPYVSSLVTSNKALYNNSLQYYIDLSKLMSVLGSNKLVVHIGSRKESEPLSESYNRLKDFCYKWLDSTEGLDIKLCLENDCGSKKGTRVGSLTLLNRLIREINNPRIRLTLDTQHAYANNLDLSDLDKIKYLLEITEVLHLNAIPKEVEMNSHKDRHSTTYIKDSKNGSKEILNIASLAYNKGIPMILERKDDLVIYSDQALVKDYLERR